MKLLVFHLHVVVLRTLRSSASARSGGYLSLHNETLRKFHSFFLPWAVPVCTIILFISQTYNGHENMKYRAVNLDSQTRYLFHPMRM
jgi:hypothetical protein